MVHHFLRSVPPNPSAKTFDSLNIALTTGETPPSHQKKKRETHTRARVRPRAHTHRRTEAETETETNAICKRFWNIWNFFEALIFRLPHTPCPDQRIASQRRRHRHRRCRCSPMLFGCVGKDAQPFRDGVSYRCNYFNRTDAMLTRCASDALIDMIGDVSARLMPHRVHVELHATDGKSSL